MKQTTKIQVSYKLYVSHQETRTATVPYLLFWPIIMNMKHLTT